MGAPACNSAPETVADGTQPGEPATTASTVSATDLAPPTTLPPLSDPGLGGSRQTAVPLGQTVDVGAWRVGVSNSVLDATELIMEVVNFNAPPEPGNQYLLVELTGIYQGDAPSQPVFAWKLVTPESEFVPDGPECGIVPNSIYDLGELGNGDQFEGTICFELPTAAVSEDLLLTLGLFDTRGDELFFALS